MNRLKGISMNRKQAEKVIPSGLYCYQCSRIENINGIPTRVQDICPFWSIDETKPEQENGYCDYLGKSDWDINEEVGDIEWRDGEGNTRITKAHEIPISLLWDQCKECDINLEYEDE
jgi:hypothetical protein